VKCSVRIGVNAVEGVRGYMTKTPSDIFREYLKAKLEGKKITLGELIERYPEHEKYLRKKFVALNLVSPPEESPPEIQDLTGSVIGDFKIIREISHGGMGVVYLAEQLSLARKVALKILRPSIFTDQKHVERFRQEGRAIAKLQHKGIVPVHLIGEHDGLFYIAMQYVEGLPLSKLINYAKEHKLRSLDPDQVKDLIAAELPEEERPSVVAPAGNNWVEMACHIIMSVGEALEFAHGQNILHRDIKPSNIILTKDGLPVLLDFGLSKDLASTDLTPTGEFLGTPAYSDPEVLFNKNSQSNVRSDVYSLGMSLYELVTFHLPYGGETISEIISSIRSNDPMPPVRFNATISRDLDAVVLKAINKESALRYQNVTEFVEDLRRFIEARPVLAKAPSLKYRAAKFLKRNRTASLVAAVAIALIIASSLTAHHFWRTNSIVVHKNIENADIGIRTVEPGKYEATAGFAIMFPEGWVIEKDTSDFFRAHLKDNASIWFSVVLNDLKRQFNKDVDVQPIYNHFLKNAATQKNNNYIADYEELKMGSAQGIFIKENHPRNDGDENHLSWNGFRNGVAISITATLLGKDYNRNLNIVEPLIRSIKF